MTEEPTEPIVMPLAAAEPSPEPVVHAAPAMPMPVQAAPFAVPVAFHAVSQHDEAEESHRPVRRKRHDSETGEPQAAAPSQLQLVETSAPVVMAPAEDELPHRTKPRRRRGTGGESGPLKLVETQAGEEAKPASPDNPTPPAA
jgi:hypothetical protein